MPPRHLAVCLVALAATAAPVAGCGGSSGSDNAQRAAKPSGSPHSASSRSSQSAGGGASAVTIDNFKFTPASLTVKRGARVTVSNDDSTTHTATADSGHAFDTGDVAPGSSATITLSKPGTYAYHCSIHPFMHGRLVVK